MKEETICSIILVFIIINIILLILYRITKKVSNLHKILSLIDNLCFVIILGLGFYNINHLLIVLVPCVLLIVYPISWGLIKELSEKDRFFVVKFKTSVPITNEARKKVAIEFLNIVTFPFIYLLETWRKA